MKLSRIVLTSVLVAAFAGPAGCGAAGSGGSGGAPGTGGAGSGGNSSGSGGATTGTGTGGSGGAPSSGGAVGSGGAPGSGGSASGGVGGGGGRDGGGGRAAGGASAGGSTGAGSGGRGGAGAGSGGGGGGGGTTAGCDPALTTANRATVAKAINELFVMKDATAIDRYWADPYLQHNPIARSGVATFKSLIGGLVMGASFSYQHLLTLAECDLAVVYGRYAQTGVIFDMFRLRDGKIMEHWDSESAASESSGLDPHDAAAPTASNRTLFTDFAQAVLIGGATARAAEFLSATYSEHHGTPASGPSALGAWLSAENVSYSKVHHLIVDGNYVFAVSEGKRGSAGFGFYDLFRLDGGKVAEHWDARRSIPSSTMSGLPIF